MTQYYIANYYANSDTTLTSPATHSNSSPRISKTGSKPRTHNTQHQPQTITHGIPQGSTLSTTFFLLDINDIIKTVVYTFADDTPLIVAVKHSKHYRT
jgi:hypothetical protein